MKHTILVIAILSFASCWLATIDGVAQIAREELPEVAQDIGVDQKPDAQLPLDLYFHDDDNNYVRLGNYFIGKKPVLLSFNYSDCPKLCSVQLRNLSMALQDIRLKPGKDFELVIVSIDPNEQSSRAKEFKKTYVALAGDLDAESGWHVLTGDKKSIDILADSVGFKFKYVPEQKIFSHPAAFIFCSPKGKVVRYLDGLDGELRFKLDKALMEAGEGKTGTLFDKFMYFSGCYVFDEHEGRYNFAMMGIMRWGGAITVLGLAIWLVPTWFRKFKPTPADTTENDFEPSRASGLE